MQELEKILKEIKSALKEIYLDIANNYDISDLSFDDSKVACVASKFRCAANDKVEKIIHKHMFSKDADITNKCGDCSRRKWYQKGYEDGKKNDGWISVDECLPEDDIDVLVTYADIDDENYTDICITTYGYTYLVGNKLDYKEWRNPFLYFKNNYKIIAWRPLPKPYHPERPCNISRRK